MTSSEILVQQEVGQGMFREYKTVKPLGSMCVSSPDLWVPACLILFAPVSTQFKKKLLLHLHLIACLS